MEHDIRLKIIDLNLGFKILKKFEDNWIYIKMVSHTSKNSSNCAYFKFKLKDFMLLDDDIFFYGNEDEDRLYLNKSGIVQTECSPEEDEILFKIASSDGVIEVFIKKYLPILNVRLDELTNPNKNIIITEGQTDWKHLRYALKKLNENGMFESLDIEFFEPDKCKIFIFDRDADDINSEFGDAEVLYHGNNVYSMLLPVPEHRKDTPNISIEHYYFDKDLFREDSNGRRLYMVKEFDKITKKHLLIPNLYALKINKESNDIGILDYKIMKYEEQEVDLSKVAKDGQNIALSKSNFIKHIENGEFKGVNVGAFSSVFTMIEDILKDYLQNKAGEIEISKGAYLKKYPTGLSTLSLFAEAPKELLTLYKGTNLVSVGPVLLENHNKLILEIEALINEEWHQIIQFPLDITPYLVDFIMKKNKNRFNRIEFHLFSPDREIRSSREILKDEISGTILLRALNL
ncbi:hypothetical protein ASE42_10180 [Bacillus sp. Root920]|uniref:hypothetical protein n=1 Tax=Bacillus sp. Root920 TaxID=1736608 RepID=UPI000700F965|nr:hypothetical protein [Bacillus sp. Root920]KRE20232.1 hypothetical protein ASE42_10180 [Bacillus sp. Root920]